MHARLAVVRNATLTRGPKGKNIHGAADFLQKIDTRYRGPLRRTVPDSTTRKRAAHCAIDLCPEVRPPVPKGGGGLFLRLRS